MRKLFLCMLFLAALSFDAHAGVRVHDDVVRKGKPVMLIAETTGRFFAKGGQVVEFSVDGKNMGRALSGGDGYAYKEFTPKRRGLHVVTARSSSDEAEGLLLSLERGTGILFIDVAGALFESLITRAPRMGSREAVGRIRKRFPVVYLNRLPAASGLMKKWVKDGEFPDAPLLDWDGGGVFHDMAEKGFKAKVVVGSPDVLESSREFEAEAFTFEEAEGATQVGGWKEIEDALR
jgi:hypothetical protein